MSGEGDTATRAVQRARHALPLAHLAAMLFFLLLAVGHYDRGTGFTRYICFGDRFTQRQIPEIARAQPFVFRDSSGYDGQFYAQLALSPLLAEPALDTALDRPEYRARRIALPWLAWLAGLGQPAWVLQMYALANIAAWFALAILLLRRIAPENATALLAWLGCLFGAGVMMSVERALTDLPSTLAIAVAILLAERGRTLGAWTSFALAVLTRETSALAGVALAPGAGGGRAPWIRAGVLAALSIAPFAAWAIYVHARFGGIAGVDGENFSYPFAAMVSAIGAGAPSESPKERALFAPQLLAMLGLCVQFLSLAVSARKNWRDRWWRAGAAFALLFAVLGPAVWTDAAAAARAVIPMTLAFNILLPRERRWSFVLCVLGNLPMLRSLPYLLAPDWRGLW